ncbi:LysR family transcriptional regulator [Thalassotalea nanhaiensis]|uniref:LysR family transcriptional regulator n=1 Tax=Thalassotalea nanhaiensis TaxID=3065648 RepID=A0ABY9TG48_9GAMM|nr:LysR family transcriptional regulator [Colwelliaceae bacterium SQ345]
MDLRSLQYYVAVYEEGSFSAAAKRSYVAQPSISAAVAQLEQTLSCNLFVRHARGVTPTAAGNKLYPLAKKLLGQAKAIKTLFIEQDSKQPFYLGVTKGLGVARMSALLKDFTASVASMELTLVPHNEQCDARVIIKEELAENEHHKSFWQENYLLAVPYNHVLSLQDNIALADFDNLAFIQRSPCSAWQSLQDILTLEGISVDIRANIKTIDYALGLVSAGLGCALVPAHPEIVSNSEIVFRPIQDLQLKREIVLAYQQPSKVINKLKQLVMKHSSVT